MKLFEIAKILRSKNAGPFRVTFDIMFSDHETYEKVKLTRAINKELIAQLYGIVIEKVQFFEYDPAFAFKVTIPRLLVSGDIGDGDIYGAQQHAPLLDIEIPLS